MKILNASFEIFQHLKEIPVICEISNMKITSGVCTYRHGMMHWPPAMNDLGILSTGLTASPASSSMRGTTTASATHSPTLTQDTRSQLSLAALQN